VVEEPPPKCPVAPQALNAAWRAELFAPPPPLPPAGGVPVWFVDVPPGTWAGGVIPCFFRQATSVARLAVEPLVVEADADFEVVLELVVELLPQAASASAATIAASRRINVRVRLRVFLGELMMGPFVVVLVSRRRRRCCY
jgi:hypothetical protein